MQLEPKDLYEKLEFNKVLNLLESECLGELGRKKIQKLGLDTQRFYIQRKLKEVQEYKICIEKNDHFPMRNYSPIEKDLRMLEVVDYVLPEEGLRRINVILRNIYDIYQFFNPLRIEAYPTLYDIIRPITFDEGLMYAIEKVIDEEGNIRADASPALLKIRKAVISKNKELDKVFRNIIETYRNRGWLTDNVETIRNGRRVLSVPSEHKRKIRGIIHDESSTGKTAFIEPEEVIQINNDIFDFQQEERREIYRILKELSTKLRPYVPVLKKYQGLMTHFDMVQAKAKLAVKMRAEMPKLLDKPHLGIQMGYHPLLLLKNKELGKETVPFDLRLLNDNRILMLSGPNAGGKSILLKSVGLMQLMLQAGMLIPVDEISEMGIFEKIFADIGDQQSLEDDLSTYSSRLKNAQTFLRHADDKTLILIDEFGSGTDPKIGGAIAEAVLKDLNDKKIYGVITTHYSNLKVFAFKTRHILNGSMMFDKDTLSPTYHFKAGRPGSSYAFEIAQKVGLSKKVLKYAKHKTGKNEKAVDQMLIDLQRERQELTEKLEAAIDREKQLEKLIKNYEHLHRDLEFKRKKFKLEAKQQALQQTQKENKELQRLVKKIKEEKNLEKAKELAVQAQQERKELVKEVTGLHEEVYYKPQPAAVSKKGPIKVGDFVRLRSGGATGVVESIDRKTAIVQMGIMRVTVKLRDLQHGNAPLDVKSTKSVQTDMLSENADFNAKLDIRGMRLDEALKTVQEFMDRALISSTNQLKIIHGKGNGVLRKAVKSKLREYKNKMRIYHPEEKFGGDGVTLIEVE